MRLNHKPKIQMSGISSIPTRPCACSVVGSESSIPNEQKRGTWGKGPWKTPFWTNPTNQKPIFYASELKWHCDIKKNGGNGEVGLREYKGEWGRWSRRGGEEWCEKKGEKKERTLVMDDGDYEGGTLWFLTLWLSFDDNNERQKTSSSRFQPTRNNKILARCFWICCPFLMMLDTPLSHTPLYTLSRTYHIIFFHLSMNLS